MKIRNLYYCLFIIIVLIIPTTVKSQQIGIYDNGNENKSKYDINERFNDINQQDQMRTETTVDRYKLNPSSNKHQSIGLSSSNPTTMDGTTTQGRVDLQTLSTSQQKPFKPVNLASTTTPSGVDMDTQLGANFFYDTGSSLENQYGPAETAFYSKYRSLEDYNEGTRVGLIRDFAMGQNAQINLANELGFLDSADLNMFHQTEVALDRNNFVYYQGDNELYINYWRINKVRYEIQMLNETGDKVNIFDGNQFLINPEDVSFMALYKEPKPQFQNGEENIIWDHIIETSASEEDPTTEYANFVIWGVEKFLELIPYYNQVQSIVKTMISLKQENQVNQISVKTDIVNDPKTFALEFNPTNYPDSRDDKFPYYLNINLNWLGQAIAKNRLHELQIKTIVETTEVRKKALLENAPPSSLKWVWRQLDQDFTIPYSMEEHFQYIPDIYYPNYYVIQPQNEGGVSVPNIVIEDVGPNPSPKDAFITKLSDDPVKPFVIMFHEKQTLDRVTEISLMPPPGSDVLEWKDIAGNIIDESQYLQMDSNTKGITMNADAKNIFLGSSSYYPIILLSTADSDNDGLYDYQEVITYGTDPIDADSDDDSLNDYQEVITYGTNPNDADSDNDGMSDGWEVTNGLDPLVDDATLDEDGDGLLNIEERDHLTDVHDPDTDDDGMPDGWEVDNGIDPLENDRNEDEDSDQLTNFQEYTLGYEAGNPDTDDDLITDGNEDLDGDGLSNYQEYSAFYGHVTDPADSDSDNDGVNDGDEMITHGSDPNDDNTDADTLNDGEEINTYGTDPTDEDTDGDGLWDDYEVANSLDPLVDQVLPVVTITSPSNGADVSGSVLIQFTATDSNLIGSVELWVDGVLKYSDIQTPFEYWLDTTTLSDGSHTVVAKGFDTAGNEASDSINIEVDNNAPTQTLGTSSQYYYNGYRGGWVKVVSTTSDTYGIQKVEFYLETTLVFTDVSGSYEYTWSDGYLSTGTHSIMVKSYDNNGNIKTDFVDVTVDNTAPSSSGYVYKYQGGWIGDNTHDFYTSSISDSHTGILKVEFYIDGSYKTQDTTSSYRYYNFYSSSYSNGQHYIYIKIHDRVGNVRQSSTVYFNVDNSNPYIYSTTGVYNGYTYQPAAWDRWYINGYDNGGSGVSRVMFYVDGSYRHTDYSYSYSFVFYMPTEDGTHWLKAVMYDKAGNTYTKEIWVDIDNAGGPMSMLPIPLVIIPKEPIEIISTTELAKYEKIKRLNLR